MQNSPTQIHKTMIFVPVQINFTQLCTFYCGMLGATMAFDTSPRMTTMTSSFGSWPTTMGFSTPQSLCYSSAWSHRQSSVTEVPIELEQSLTKEALTWCFQTPLPTVPHIGQWGWSEMGIKRTPAQKDDNNELAKVKFVPLIEVQNSVRLCFSYIYNMKYHKYVPSQMKISG